MGGDSTGFFEELVHNWFEIAGAPTNTPLETVQHLALEASPDAQKQMLLDAAKAFLGLIPSSISPVGQLKAEEYVIRESPDTKLVRTDFLTYEAAVLGGIVLAPVLYEAIRTRSKGKKGKHEDEIASGVESASNRAVTLLAAIAPAVAIPAAYITVQGLENRGVLSKGLGNDVQTLITAMAVGPTVAAMTGPLSSIVKAVV